jgi:MraZ protein
VRFVSTFEAGVDEKRRVTIPADFRASLRQSGGRTGQDGDHVLVWEGDGPWLEASDAEFVEAICAAAEDAANDPEAAGELVAGILGGSRKLALDTAGRVVLPEAWVAAAGLNERAVFMGIGPLFRIASPAVAADLIAAARERSRTLKPAIMAAARRRMRGAGQ